MSRKFGFGKASSGDDEAADAKGEKNEAPRDADATQAVTPPLPANPLQDGFRRFHPRLFRPPKDRPPHRDPPRAQAAQTWPCRLSGSFLPKC